MSDILFKPAKGKILVKPVKRDEKVTVSGIVLPSSVTDERAIRGTVVVSSYADLPIGEEVLFSKFGYDEAELDGETHYVVSITNILGVFA